MFRRGTKQQRRLNKLIRKYVKQGYRVQDKGADFVSLYKPAMSISGSLLKTGATMMTLGIAGRGHQPDLHKTIYIYVDEQGKSKVTKGKASL